MGSDLWSAGAWLSVLQVTGVAGALVDGLVSDRLGRWAALFISLTVAPILMFFFLSVHDGVQFPLLVLLGFFVISTTPVLMALAQESFPQNRALANGAYLSLSFVIGSEIVVLFGALGDRFGLHHAFLASGVLMFLGLPFLFLLPGRGHMGRSSQIPASA